MNDTAREKLQNAIRQEVLAEQTKETDQARYETANAVLVDAMETGGGFADALSDFMKSIESNTVLHLTRKADPENRAALFEIILAFHRFGVSPQIEAHFCTTQKPENEW